MEEDIKNNIFNIENLYSINSNIENYFMNTPIGILKLISEKEIKIITYYPRYEKETIIKL